MRDFDEDGLIYVFATLVSVRGPLTNFRNVMIKAHVEEVLSKGLINCIIKEENTAIINYKIVEKEEYLLLQGCRNGKDNRSNKESQLHDRQQEVRDVS